MVAAACAAGLDQRPAVASAPLTGGQARSPRDAASTPRPVPAQIPALHRLAGAGSERPVRVRNLFAFGRAPARARVPSFTAPQPASPPASVSLPPTDAPQLKLIGVAEDVDEGRAVRIAFVSSLEELFAVKEGDLVTAGFAVLNISATQVELLEPSKGNRLILTLGAGLPSVRP